MFRLLVTVCLGVVATILVVAWMVSDRCRDDWDRLRDWWRGRRKGP